ncbi:hypothetical protein RvY_14768 [Ramazzottius varieornatus]|uniref:Uncharacterized protein n=1 Tax=Ramazzottius varieornatus TaxID=947166 RepID=A0A1D1W0T0_RAMVA|nr:hypothetical protein RvY_14768 [Ramazzottius varieornatus]
MNLVAAPNHVIRTIPITALNASNLGMPSSPIATPSEPSTLLPYEPVTTQRFISLEIPVKAFTPLIPERFANVLKDYPDSEFANYFVKGLINGFRLGYTGPAVTQITPNARTAREHPDVVRDYVAKEVIAKHTIGPFDVPPFPYYVFSSMDVRPKKLGGVRLTMDLSRPFKSQLTIISPKQDYTQFLFG